jgi:hypothetical protein
MSTRRRQLGFLLNPYRFAGTVQQGALSMNGAATLTFVAASIAAAPISADGIADLALSNDQVGASALSVAGASTVTLSGASDAAGALSADAAASLDLTSEPAALLVDAADLDGTNDYVTRGAALTGQAASKTGILSFWIEPDALNAQLADSLDSDGGGWHPLQLFLNSAGNLSFTLNYVGGVAVSWNQGSNALSAAGGWYHVLIAWDTAAGTAGSQCYINDTLVTLTTHTVNNQNVAWDGGDDYAVGATVSGVAKFNGGMAEFYLAPGQLLDFSVEANRRKFRTSAGKPADLGANGETPTGTAALVYLHLDDGETANNFAINRGTGGNLTVTGALTTFATSPSD